jgi:phosphoglycerol transferase MdoB-like AlkP superfamily enzyme
VAQLGKQLLKTQYANLKRTDYKYYIPLTILLYGLCFLGLRGSLQRYPLQIGYAYFSNNPLFNQLGINPCFSLLKNLDSSKRYKNVNDLMPVDSAFLLVHKALNIEPTQNSFNVSREVRPQGEVEKPSIVIVILESMATKYLDYECADGKLMPFLHELISKSYYFENCYSSGAHTNNGIASMLYGIPTLFSKHSMKNEAHYTGLPVNLRKQGYQNLFFLTGNPHFDHMNFFLMEGGFDRIYSQEDYPSGESVNVFGVQDDVLFQYGLDRINDVTLDEKPFLAVFLTVSNHPPYIVPQQYTNIADTDDKKMTRFVDDVLKNFMENASKEKWFENTIFVLLGDHGVVLDQPKYEMPIERNHIPLVIYSPLFEDTPKRFDSFCGQIDVFPTLMGLLNMPYINHSLGIDLLKEQRPYIYFVNDSRLGCINKDYFYIHNLNTSADMLYNLHDDACENIMQKESQILQEMKAHSVSMMVVTDYLIKNNTISK